MLSPAGGGGGDGRVGRANKASQAIFAQQFTCQHAYYCSYKNEIRNYNLRGFCRKLQASRYFEFSRFTKTTYEFHEDYSFMYCTMNYSLIHLFI